MKYSTQKKQFISQINVTPLVDVMLVLLIIFMVTAPMLQEGMEVNLPEVKASSLEMKEEPVIITVKKDGSVFINKNKMKLSGLDKKLEAIFKRKKEKMVLLKADKEVPYGFVIKTMAEIRKAGIEKVGMATEPL